MHFQALTRSLTRHPRPFPSVRAAAAAAGAVRSRAISTSPLLRTQAGYGDPQDEKIENSTPTPHAQKDAGGHAVAGHGKPSSSADPQPDGKGKGTGSSGGTTDPEIKPLEGNANKDKEVGEKEIRETKKIGEDPKKEEVGGAGVIGG